MTNNTKPLTPAEQLSHELSRLVWVAQDLQQRASIDEVPEIAYVRITEITRHTTAIRELLDSANTANYLLEHPLAAADRMGDRPTEKASSTSADSSAQTSAADRPAPKKPKGGAT
jgi:hypothetical protein